LKILNNGEKKVTVTFQAAAKKWVTVTTS